MDNSEAEVAKAEAGGGASFPLSLPTVMDVDPPATSTPLSLQEILTDTKYHVEHECWFELLQDYGVEMCADEEKSKYGTPTKGKQSNKHYNVVYCKKFYPKLYQLAQLLVQSHHQKLVCHHPSTGATYCSH